MNSFFYLRYMKHFLDTVNEVFSALSWNLSAEQLNLGGNNTSTDTGKLKKPFFLDRRGMCCLQQPQNSGSNIIC
jgi:hypothetical protein